MQKIAFGRTGLQVSRLGFGAAPIGFLKTDREKVAHMLNFMLDSGVNLIDTAAGYEGSEELIGQIVSHRRKDFVLVSKCGRAVPENDMREWSAELIHYTLDRALKRLRTDHLDVMLLHSCDLATLRNGEALKALVDAQQAGKVRFVGYSGDDEAAAEAAIRPSISVVETSVNFCDQHNIDRVLPLTRQNSVGVLAKRPVANAAWKDVSQQPGMYKNYAKPYIERFAKMGLQPADLGMTGPQQWPEIALRFTLSQPGVHCAIIGTTNPDNARANMAAAEKGPLPPEIVGRIRDAFAQAEKASGQAWTAQT